MEAFNVRWLVVVAVALLLIYFIYQATQSGSRFNAALRDSGPDSSYSFARTQLLWWTILIIMSFVISYASTGVAEGLFNESTLMLLGISMGTVAAGQIIDTGDQSNPSILRHQTNNEQQSFLLEILSDHDGINLHRFQALLFNVAFGFVYVIQFFSDKEVLPAFDNTTLGLLGLSSGGYLALKTGENTETKTQQVQARTATTTTTATIPTTAETTEDTTDTTKEGDA